MEDYKSNSNRSKKEQQNASEKRVEKVVTGRVITRKKSGVKKFTEEFISEDAHNVKSYILSDVLFPALKNLLSDIITDGVNMFLFGRRGNSSNRRSTADTISYNNYNKYYNSRSSRPSSSSQRYSYDDIAVGSRGEAEEVLDRMYELIDRYGLVRVADLYDLVGKTGDYTDNKYGWTNIRTAEIVRASDGLYEIRMPRAMPID